VNIKNLLLGGLIVTAYIVIILANVVFLYTYNSAYKLWLSGETVLVKPIELLSEPGDGRKGYRYKVERGLEVDEIYSKAKLDLNVLSSVVILPDRPKILFKLDDGYGILAAYRAVTGGWFLSIMFLVMHIGILKLTWSLCFKIPFECIRTSKLTKQSN
jgi:hypothetical protein